ncbi:hypothetical protein ACFE04_010041 [Oxalis oulophora]
MEVRNKRNRVTRETFEVDGLAIHFDILLTLPFLANPLLIMLNSMRGLTDDLKVKLAIAMEEAEKFDNGVTHNLQHALDVKKQVVTLPHNLFLVEAELLGLQCLVAYTEVEVTTLLIKLTKLQFISLMMYLGDKEKAIK